MKLFAEKKSAAAAGSGAKAPKTAPSRRELMALRPLRNPLLRWDEEGGLVVLHVSHDRARTWKTRLAGLLVPLPREHTVRLDVVGSEVWQLLDGEHSIGQIAREIARTHKLEAREAELSVQQYFKQLARRGYIGFAGAPADTGPQA